MTAGEWAGGGRGGWWIPVCSVDLERRYSRGRGTRDEALSLTAEVRGRLSVFQRRHAAGGPRVQNTLHPLKIKSEKVSIPVVKTGETRRL